MILWLLFALAAAGVARAGGGSFPDRSTKPVLPESALEIVAELPNRPGNVDVDPQTQRIFFTFHPMSSWTQGQEAPCKVCEWHESNKSFTPFPNRDEDQRFFSTVLSIRISPKRRLLYALDHKNLGQDGQPVLYQYDLNTQALLREYTFNEQVAPRLGNLNDFCLSKDENFAFIADVGIANARAGIITLNLVTGQATRALDAHESTKAKPASNNAGAHRVLGADINLDLGVDSIAISADGETVYFAAVFDSFMWMVPTRALVTGVAEDFVDIAFPKPVSDGIIVDESSGILFVTDFEHSAIWMTHPAQHGRARTLVQSNALLRWPDGLSVSGNYLYVTCSAVHELLLVPPKPRTPPYHILRIDLSNERVAGLFEKQEL